MEDFKKKDGEFTSAGRKLRPRRNASAAGTHRAEPAWSTREGRMSSEDKPHYGQRRGYGEDRPAGARDHNHAEGRPYGQRRPAGGRRTEGDNRPYGEHRSYGADRSGEGRRSFGPSRPSGERRSYGSKAPGDRKGGFRSPRRTAPGFGRNSEEGINRMISRRPQVDRSTPVAREDVPETIQEEVRLNKFIANSGVCSRREADTLIQAGCVTVNGEVVTELGTKINVFNDDVRFNGQRLKGESKVYIVMNKPKGYVTTASDPHAEKTVLDLLKGCTARVYPVGRLDKSTTGVLMFTNDGELAERLTHPSYDKKKIYQALLDKPLSQEAYDQILAGVTLTDGEEKADSLEYIDEDDHRKLGIEIHSGKNRVVRRLFEAVGYEVKALDRVYFAGLTKRGLKKGEWRYLSESEVNILKMGAYI